MKQTVRRTSILKPWQTSRVSLLAVPLLAVPLLVVPLLVVPAELSAQELTLQKHTLANGLTVYLHEDHSAPLLTFGLYFDVGSVNERPGITGISHLFEHMMFNGSSKYGPKEFDGKLESAGGTSQGYTTRDFTAYYEVFPPKAFDLVLDMEADRMASMRIDTQNLEQERRIVQEERRLRTDNDNLGKLDELIYLLAYTSHPYRAPVVGFMHDLDNIKLQDTRSYFDTYYTPNNCVAVLAGDFEPKEAMAKIEKAFSTVKMGPKVTAPFGNEPTQEGERRARIERESELAFLMAGWHVPGASNIKDMAAVDVALNILGTGESSRLYRSLVAGAQLAVEAQTWYETLQGPSLAIALLAVPPEKPLEVAEAELYKQIDRLASEPIPASELQKAKNQLRVSTLKGLKTVDDRANMIGYFAMMFGDPNAIPAVLEARDQVTEADVQRVLKQYFTPSQRTVVTLVPASTKAGGDAK